MTTPAIDQRTGDIVSSFVGAGNLPDDLRHRHTLGRVDYADGFTIEVDDRDDLSAEQWARVVLEGTPAGRSAPRLWRLLGLELGPRTPDHVQGWRITGGGDGWVRLETRSWYLTANCVVQATEGRLSLALLLRHDRWIAPLVMAPVEVLHRRAVPGMLRQARDLHRDLAARSDHPPEA
jgi:hypothetical protein